MSSPVVDRLATRLDVADAELAAVGSDASLCRIGKEEPGRGPLGLKAAEGRRSAAAEALRVARRAESHQIDPVPALRQIAGRWHAALADDETRSVSEAWIAYRRAGTEELDGALAAVTAISGSD
jgi:hypothetical protein